MSYNYLGPPSSDPVYLADVSKSVHSAITHGYQDYGGSASEVTWVIQGWMFAEDPKFWNSTTIAAFLSGPPEMKDLLVLDLYADGSPQVS